MSRHSAPPRAKSSLWQDRRVRLGVGLLLLLAGIVSFLRGGAEAPSPTTVFLLQAGDPGPDPFGPDVSQPVAAPESGDAGPGGANTVEGSVAGLFAGARDAGACDGPRLAAALGSDPGRAGSWSAVFGLGAGDLGAFVESLTPVFTRADLRVTDYALRDGRAVPRRAILEAGTAVLVDRRGVPRVRCASGNPLSAPTSGAASGEVRYSGPLWTGFAEASTATITPAPAPLPHFVLSNLADGTQFSRFPGSAAVLDADHPLPASAPPAAQPLQPAAVRGRGWDPGSAVTITFDDPAVELAQATAAGDGSFALQILIPEAARPGVHRLRLAGGGATSEQLLYVLPQDVPLA